MYFLLPIIAYWRPVIVRILKRLSLNADLCIHCYWLSRLRQASHRKNDSKFSTKTKTMTFQNLNMPPPSIHIYVQYISHLFFSAKRLANSATSTDKVTTTQDMTTTNPSTVWVHYLVGYFFLKLSGLFLSWYKTMHCTIILCIKWL